MTPTPMARAVEAVRETDYHSVCGCTDQMHKNVCYEAMLRAALPALLEAVVGEMDIGDLGRVWAMGTGYWHSTRDMPKPVSGPATGAATGMCFPDQMRAALLAALTDTAGRLP